MRGDQNAVLLGIARERTQTAESGGAGANGDVSSTRGGGLAEESSDGGWIGGLFGSRDALDAVGAVGDAPFLDEAAEGVVRDESVVRQRSACDWTCRVVVSCGDP